MYLIADNLHALNPVVAGALRDLDPRPLRDLVRRCHQAGAKLLDLNPGYLSPRHEDRITFMVEAVQEVCDLRLVLDSANPRVLARGLAACRDKPILNGLSLEPRRLDEVLGLAVEAQTDLVLLLMDGSSMAPTRLEEKVAVALELREVCLSAGLPEELLIFDPVVPTLRGPDAFFHAGQTLQTLRLLSGGALLGGPARTMAGLSNLRSGQKKVYPHRIEEIYLGLLTGAGLTYALADALTPETPAALGIMNYFA